MPQIWPPNRRYCESWVNVQEVRTVFETAQQHKDDGVVWGVIAGVGAFLLLLTTGWLLVG